jgi:two-component system cell cycle sensor histidine kinase/response regulator CckA
MAAKELMSRRDVKFRPLFEDSPLPMWIFDVKSLRFLEVNQAAIAHYGYSREEFLAMTLPDLRPDGASRPPAQAGALPGGGQSRHRLKDGRIIEVEVASHSITHGGESAVLCVLNDVTERNQLEERLRQAAKMEAVGMLAGGIAHDFNNLLTIINGYSHILLGSLPEGDPNHAAAEQIMKAGERAAALTRQLLAFSRRQVLQPRILDLNQLVTGLENMLRRLIGEDVDLRLVCGGDLGQVSADPGQVEQVIINLAVNARDAMPGGGILTIETSNVTLDAHYALGHTTIKPGEYVALVVSDNGAGMDPSTRARLFEPFFTTKEEGKGTGLGLTTVFGIVKQGGGSVEVYSDPGHGTSVKVFLPRQGRRPNEEVALAPVKGGRGTETILLVEDDEAVRKLVRETLLKQGYTVRDAQHAAAARHIAASHPGPIHLLITDVVMPLEGGRELAASLTRLRPETKVLFMSGYTDQAVVNNGLLNSEAAFLQKPFTPAALAAKVRETLDSNGESHHHAGGLS